MDILSIDKRHAESNPRILLYSSCIADQLRNHLLTKPAIADKFSVDSLIIHILQGEGYSDLAKTPFVEVVKKADFIFTNNFSPRWGDMGTHRVFELKKPSAKVFTWVPPSITAFWPVMEYDGEHGVVKMIQAGATDSQIADAFNNGTFDAMFSKRWCDEINRLRFREEACDIGVSDFCVKHHREVKLWFTENHPTYHLIAWIGLQIGKLLGECIDTEETCLQYNHAATGTWNVLPETEYEFNHFQFKYPIQYTTTEHWGDKRFYLDMIARVAARYNAQKGIFRY